MFFLKKVKNTLTYLLLFVFLVLLLGGCKKTPKVQKESLDLVVNEQSDITHLLDKDVEQYEFVNNDTLIAVCEKGIVTAVNPGDTTLVVKLKKKGTVVAELTIKVVLQEFEIIYHLNSGTNHPENPSNYTVRDLPILLHNPSLEGYRFLGWYSNDNFSGESITEITEASENAYALHAKWEKIVAGEFLISYQLDGGTLTGGLDKYQQEDLPHTLVIPTKEGYTFLGWYLDQNKTNQITTITSLMGDVVLYAKWEKNVVEYPINYHLNGGTLSKPKNTYYEEILPLVLPEPTRDGFIFIGWHTDEGLTNKITTIEKGHTGAIILYAKWQVDDTPPETQYSIIYNLNDGVLSNQINQYTESALPLTLPIPTRTDHSFEGWFTESEFTNKITTIEKGHTGDVVLYAKWEALQEDEYLITYELNGGDLANPINKYSESVLPLTLPIPTRSGYIFKGWFTDPGLTNSITTINQGQIGNIALYANWEKEAETEYLIAYELNGGSLTNPISKYTESVLPLTLPIPTRSGYIFKGWFTETAFTNEITTINKGQTGNIIVYAQWEKEPLPEYTITYNLDGGNLSSPVNKFTDDDLPLTLPIPTKEEYTFEGWYTDSSKTTKITSINKGHIGNVVLYANWEAVPSTEYSIAYELDGGKFDYSKEDLKTDFLKDYYEFLKPTVDLNTFMHGEGKTSGFGGTWAKKEIVDGLNQVTIVKLYQANSKEADINLDFFINQPKYNAKWKPFFDLIDTLVNETNPDQHFWSSTWTGNVRLREYFTGERYGDEERLPVNVETVAAPLSYKPQDTITLVAPKRTGYDFAGWYDNSTFQGSPITVIVKGSSGNKRLYAKWVKQGEVEEYTVIYNLDGGTLSSPKTKFSIKDLPYTLQTPIKSGYKFLGWYSESSLTTKVTQITTTGNKVFYAKWEKIQEYTITYNLDGGTLSNPKVKFIADDLPYTLPNPIKSEYKFLGWYSDSALTTKVTQITTVGNKVLYAKWEKLDPTETFTITYTLNGGSLASPKSSYTVAELPLTLQTPTKANYAFDGWYLTSDFSGSKVTKIEITMAGNLTLYAKWINSDYTVTYNLNGGKWLIASKDDLKKDFLQDFYNYVKPSENLTTFMHGSGKTSGYDGTWHSTHKEKLYVANDKTSDASKPYFINQPQYNTKWVPFFNLLDTMVKEVNDTQSFWGSTWTGHIRIREYFTGERWADDNRLPTNLPGIQDFHKKYNSETLPLTLPTPSRDGYVFGGWYEKSDFSGSSVSVIPKGSTGNKVFYAKWTSTPYNITYVLNGGSWYSSKNDMKNDFLTDFYNYLGKPGGNLTTFIHGAGKTSGYAGTWYDHRDSLYAMNDKSSDATKEYFINQPLYNKKWLVFFNYMDTLVKETNPEQNFWGSHYTGCLRLKQYLTEELYKDKTAIPAVVKAPGLYIAGAGLSSIPTPTMSGTKFLGWYEKADFSGSPITSIPTTATGNKTLYAKWDIVAPPVGSVYLRLNYSGNGALTAGQKVSVSVTAIVTGGKPVDPITWSSSNNSVATVDQNGRVTAVGRGTVIITCKTVASGAVSTVGFTVYGSEISDPLLKYLITQNTGVLWTRNITYYGFTGNYVNRISNTVNKFLPESLSITAMTLSSSAPNNPNRAMSSLQYIVVHDTGSAGSASNARANGGWCVNPSNTGSSWHYTTGNDGIFKHMGDKMVAWHAGDGSVTFSNRNTGVKATTTKPKVTVSGGYVYFNGTKSVITSSYGVNSEGLLVSVGSNGNYYVGPTWVNNSVLVNKGGNSNGIGIETAVNSGSDVYFTWQRTAKLIADLATKYGLGLGQVGFHRNFSNKLCPQTMINAGLQNEFWKLVEAEYMVRRNYSGYTISFTSHNTSIINNHGRIVKYPTNRTNVQYTIKVTKGTTTQSITLNALVPGTKDF